MEGAFARRKPSPPVSVTGLMNGSVSPHTGHPLSTDLSPTFFTCLYALDASSSLTDNDTLLVPICSYHNMTQMKMFRRGGRWGNSPFSSQLPLATATVDTQIVSAPGALPL